MTAESRPRPSDVRPDGGPPPAWSDAPSEGAHFTTGDQTAARFGVHEIALTGGATAANPFDTPATVTFVPPSGEQHATTVHAFYDGGDVWRARLYVSEVGGWTWVSRSEADPGLDGRRGAFAARGSDLRGRLLVHPRNPRQWMTENGRWFLNLNDTAYFLLSTHDALGQPIPFEDVAAYVRDAVARGITSVRSWAVTRAEGMAAAESSSAWDAVFSDAARTRLRVASYQHTDRCLRWLLDRHPDLYVQLIILPLGTRWRTDESFWAGLSAAQKERLLRHLVARFAAWPQIFWLIVNDAHYVPDRLITGQEDVARTLREATYPNNIALAREVGGYLRTHDPWQHPRSTGHARTVPFQFGREDWATYLHLEDLYDLGAAAYDAYHGLAKPVFLGEDRYEQDRPDRDPLHMRYYQRRLFWAWLLAGGSANYGGRWWVVHPYSETGTRSTVSPWHKEPRTIRGQLTGLDSVRFIREYFEQRAIELSDFEADQELATDAAGAEGIRAPKLMRRGQLEFLVYHPNAAEDGRAARPDAARRAGVILDLRAAAGAFGVEWYRAEDGVACAGGTVEGGSSVELTAPWAGHDVVLRLRRE